MDYDEVGYSPFSEKRFYQKPLFWLVIFIVLIICALFLALSFGFFGFEGFGYINSQSDQNDTSNVSNTSGEVFDECDTNSDCDDGDYLTTDACDGTPKRCHNILIDQSGNDTCVPSWNCSSWGSCVGGTKTRTCTDLNDCGDSSSKPAESESCVSQETEYSILETEFIVDELTSKVEFASLWDDGYTEDNEEGFFFKVISPSGQEYDESLCSGWQTTCYDFEDPVIDVLARYNGLRYIRFFPSEHGHWTVQLTYPTDREYNMLVNQIQVMVSDLYFEDNFYYDHPELPTPRPWWYGFFVGEPIIITSHIAVSGETVSWDDATFSAEITYTPGDGHGNHGSFYLNDLGEDYDLVRGDGIYTGAYLDTSEPESYCFRVSVSGENDIAGEYQRTLSPFCTVVGTVDD